MSSTMYLTTGAGAAYHANAGANTTACTQKQAHCVHLPSNGTAYPTGAGEICSPTGAGAAYLTGAGHKNATTYVDAAFRQVQCTPTECKTCVGLCKCEVLHDWR